MSRGIRLLHISDLHFYETDDQQQGRFRHDLSCLVKIEQLVKKENPEYLIVSGDLTNIGDQLSLDRVYQWIHDHIVVEGNEYGLNCDARGIGVIVVPGNHDAYNAQWHGANHKRWQSSLTNYKKTFHKYLPSDQSGVLFRWLSKGGTDIFICCLDSCYLGDGDSEANYSNFSVNRVAKGKISRSQASKILEIYDQGMSGELKDSDGNCIDRGRFLAAIKLVVMHHYLFEPVDCQFEPFMDIKQVRSVFQNFAMADFDAMMCGHKHRVDTRQIVYLDKFDARGRARLALNHVRRTLGIGSLPVPYDDNNGHPEPRLLRIFLVIWYYGRERAVFTEEDSNEIIGILQDSMTDPEVLNTVLKKLVSKRRSIKTASLFEEDEIAEIYRRVKSAFNKNEFAALKRAADKMQGLVAKLAGRPFVQFSCGSSAKATEIEARSRSVCVYDIFNDEESKAYILRSTRFSWVLGADTKRSRNFVRSPEVDHRFPHSRI